MPLHYIDAGRRLPLLFVHGFPLDSGLWEPQVLAFSTNRRVIVPDLAGFGASSGPSRENLDEHAGDLIELMDSLHIEKAVVCGLSMGGYIAMSMLRIAPKRVGGLVLACTRAGEDTEAAKKGRLETAAKLEETGMEVLAKAMGPKLFGEAAPQKVREEIDAMIRRQTPGSAAAALKAMAARPDAHDDLMRFETPALVISGAQDQIMTAEDAEAMAKALPDAQHIDLPNAGHIANLEEPGAFNAALRGYLQRLDLESAGA